MNSSLRTSCGTSGYRAPELIGLLPRNFKNGKYTNAVDIWSLGIITHEILTSEIPFRLSESSMTLESDSGINTEPQTPEVDMDLVFEYCRDRRGFPVDALERSGVGKEGVDFVMRLLAAGPEARISAKDCLECAWLLEK